MPVRRVKLVVVNAQRTPSSKHPLPFFFLYTGCHLLQEASQPELRMGCLPFSLGSGVRSGRSGSRSSALEVCAVEMLRPLGRARI